jgi:hypothetical protein
MNGAFCTLDEADEVSCSQRFCIETVSRAPLGYRFALVACLTIWAARRCWNKCRRNSRGAVQLTAQFPDLWPIGFLAGGRWTEGSRTVFMRPSSTSAIYEE